MPNQLEFFKDYFICLLKRLSIIGEIRRSQCFNHSFEYNIQTS